MSTRAILVWLLLCAPATAANDAQWLKAFGHFPSVRTDQVQNAAADPALCAEVLASRFCLHPDFPDREMAVTDPKQTAIDLDLPESVCQALQSMHRRMLTATGRGSWPAGWHPEYPDHHAAVHFLDWESFRPGFKTEVSDRDWQSVVAEGVWPSVANPVQTVAECKARFVYRDARRAAQAGKQVGDTMVRLHFAAWIWTETSRRAGCAEVWVFDPSEFRNVTFKNIPIPGSVIGWAEFNNGTKGDSVRLMIDTAMENAPILDICWLGGHEAGHTKNLQHTFNGQSGSGGHHGLMSYANVGCQGYRPNGDAPYRFRRDPSWQSLTGFFGGEAVPRKDGPVDPPPPTGGGDGNGWTLGHEFTVHDGGQIYTLRVVKIDGDQGPNFVEQIAAEFAKIEPYASRERHRQAMAGVYQTLGQAIDDEGATVADSIEAIKVLRGILLGGAAGQWADVFKLADNVTTADGFRAVAKGLGFKLAAWADASEWTGGEILAMIQANQGKAFQIPPAVLQVIKLVVQIMPAGPVKNILQIVLAIIEGFQAKAVGGGDGDGPIQKPAKSPPPPLNEPKTAGILQRRRGGTRPPKFEDVVFFVVTA